MRKLSAFLYKIANRWVTLAAVGVFLVFSLLTLPAQSAAVKTYDHGMGSPDTSLFYNSQTITQMAEAYGENGRSAYVNARWTFDLVFPFVYTFFLLTTVSFVMKRAALQQTRWRLLNLLPLGGFFFDLAENAAASVVMSAYPVTSAWAAALAPFFTPLKWLLIVFSFLLIVCCLVRWGYLKLKQSHSK